MTTPEPPDVRSIILNSSTFGPDEAEKLSKVILGQVRDARTALAELKAKANPTPRDTLAIGITSYILSDFDAAQQILGTLHNDGIAQFYVARCHMAREQYAEAEKAFAQAAKLGYDNILCTLCRVGALRLMGNESEAEQLLRSTGRDGATRAEYSYQMGALLADKGDYFGAIEYFERCADMDPQHTGALFRLAALNNQMGNEADAIRLYERALSKAPLTIAGLLNLGLLYEDVDNYKAAAYCFTRVLNVQPQHERAMLYLKDIEATHEMYYDEDAQRREREMEQILKIPITDFELSARSRNCLEKAFIFTLGDLTRVTEQDLLANKNFGETSLKEINEIMATKGLHIGQAMDQPKPQIEPSYQRDDLSPQQRTMMSMPVSELSLSVRARKCLTRLGIASIGELMVRSADELLSVRNFGVTSLNEIRAELEERGLSLRND